MKTNTTVLIFKIPKVGKVREFHVYLLIITAGATEKEGLMSIQKNKAGDFKNSTEKEGDAFKATVTDAYLYGQKKGGSNRFLVYHDKARDIFQVCHVFGKHYWPFNTDIFKHRFVQGMVSKIGDNATEMATNWVILTSRLFLVLLRAHLGTL